jgi:hypothetical protein
MPETIYHVNRRFRDSSALRFRLGGESPVRHARQIMGHWGSIFPAEWRVDPKAGKKSQFRRWHNARGAGDPV